MKKIILLTIITVIDFLISCNPPLSSNDPVGYTGYYITYETNAPDSTTATGTVPIDSNYYKVGMEATVLGNTGNIEITDYYFSGWNTAADGTGTTYSAGQKITINGEYVILYAIWDVYSKVIYNVNVPSGATLTSGTVPVDNTNYEDGQIVTVPGNTGNLLTTDYYFSGWNTAADGIGTTYSAGQKITINGEYVILYAIWDVYSKVIYNVNVPSGATLTSGTVPVDNTNYEDGQIVTVPGNTGNLLITDYNFTGWATMADGSGKVYASGQTFNVSSSNITLYALWVEFRATDYTIAGITFAMTAVPAITIFPTGTDDSGTGSVSNPYWIAQTQVTYELWSKVYEWATSNGYTFANVGVEGSNDTGGTGMTNQHPVTKINWRDAIIWCNALTEYYNAQNGTSYACVYCTDITYGTPIRSADNSKTITTAAGTEDNPCVNSNAKGFRLMTSNEYELAARWRGSDSTNTVSGYSNPYFTKGNSLSGAITYFNDVTGSPNYAGKLANNAVAVYSYYWDGSDWVDTGVWCTAQVASKSANALGLYDMSGNVNQLCFDWFNNIYREAKGGCCFSKAEYLQVGYTYNAYYPYETYDFVGFRFVRTQ